MELVEVVGGILGAGVVAAWLSAALLTSSARRRRRALRSAPVEVSDFPDGTEAKIIGRAQPHHEPLTAPLSGRKCVYYRVVIYDDKGHDSVGAKKFDETECEAFLLVTDGSGTATVECESSTFRNLEHVARNPAFDLAGRVFRPPRAEMLAAASEHRRFLRSRGEEELAHRAHELTYREAVLEVGAETAVFGVGRRGQELDDEAHPYRGKKDKRLVIRDALIWPLGRGALQRKR